MTKTSWVEICVSDFEQSIKWFEDVLGFRVVAQDANDYAELSRGETSIQLGTDRAPYWAPERPRLLPPGQRGSGVEIVLLVENVDAVYRQAQQAQADIVRPLADYPWHMRQFWVRHPDGYLIRPAQKILSVNPATYRRQVTDAFERDTPRIPRELLEVQQIAGSERQAYCKFWLDLQKESLDDESYLRICRETGRISDLIDRLLMLGRVDEAAREAQQVDDNTLLGLIDLFIQHRQDAMAERLMRARISAPIRPANDAAHLLLRSQPGRVEEGKPDWRVLEWLQKYYRDRGNRMAELEIAETLFRTQPFLKRYQELRDLARRLDRWEALRPEVLTFLEQAKNTSLLIQIALDEGDIDRALQLLKGMAKKDIHGYTYNNGYGYFGFGDIALQVARAAEEVRPREAIELYRQSAERLIALRGRQNYQEACKYLAKMRVLYEKLGEGEAWTSYITVLREQNRNLRALKEELAAAGL